MQLTAVPLTIPPPRPYPHSFQLLYTLVYLSRSVFGGVVQQNGIYCTATLTAIVVTGPQTKAAMLQ